MNEPDHVVTPLHGLRVIQGSGGIEVAYCTKMLVDAGAEVVVLEPADGHPLRRRQAAPAGEGGPVGALFAYLHAGKGSVVDGAAAASLLDRADVLVSDRLPSPWEELHARHPRLTAVAITPFGLHGPWADRPSSDLVLQAMSGGMAPRGDVSRAPLMAGGEPTPWFAGAVAVAALLGVLPRVRATGIGELLDASQLEAAHLEHSMYPVTYASMAATPFHQLRGVPVPGIEPTSDGHVGFFVITGQQWLDFCALIEQPAWTEDESLFIAMERRRRSAELVPVIREWSTARTTAEIVEIASLMRIPVAPIGNGRTIPEIDHFVDQEWLVPNPAGFVQPRRPYRFRDEPVNRIAPAPSIGATDAGTLWADAKPAHQASADVSELPLAGIRVADFTAFWAGPLAAHVLAGLGAEVIHIEGPRRPDGIRMNTLRRLTDAEWWEWSPLFCGANTNKRGIAVDLSTPEGHEIALRLLATCDVMIENFSPRVVEQLGLGPDAALAANPRLVVVRMPAFGVSGPWRDRVGFAQTIEQASGLAFLTGYAGETPVMPNGMCDPIAGVHAAIAALVALHERDADRARPGRRDADGRRRAQHRRRADPRVRRTRAPDAERGKCLAVRRAGSAAVRRRGRMGGDHGAARGGPRRAADRRPARRVSRISRLGARRALQPRWRRSANGSACRWPVSRGRTRSSRSSSSSRATSSRTSATPSPAPTPTSRFPCGSRPGPTAGTGTHRRRSAKTTSACSASSATSRTRSPASNERGVIATAVASSQQGW